ncbi:MAG: organic radical activating enzyme [Lentimonas sp.]|jgi:7-carboxy-7-deazaguanine synthase
MKLPIHERFYSFQGEGVHAGRAAYFIRTFGCPVHCPWCDSAGTWHPDYIPKKIARFEPEELAAEAAKTAAEFTVITGGEPTIHDLTNLTEELHAVCQKVHLETSGAFAIKGTFDWITLSPKRWKLPLAENIDCANEFKLIIDRPEAIEEYVAAIMKNGTKIKADCTIWLHPEWSQHDNSEILNRITEWIKIHGAPYRAGWQLHKNYAADLLDQQSVPAAPLGGIPEKGF